LDQAGGAVKIANVADRAVIVTSASAGFDVHEASAGRFGPDLPSIYDNWGEFVAWAQDLGGETETVRFHDELLGAPSPSPRQVFAIGLNYRDHAAESGFDAPTHLPPVFTKFVSSVTGPYTSVSLPPGGNTDWEVELVAVIGVEASQVHADQAWRYVAGLTVGQDLSERVSQLRGPAPQFGLGKSFGGFSPTGPWMVTIDELTDPDNLELGCAIDGVTVQQGRTSDLIFSVPRLVAELSRTVVLYPGDLIFTGTPAGVGLGRKPQRFLQPGETLRSWIQGIGEIRQSFKAAEEHQVV
jgi:2-keto-4-pentenoate hydratase/2-oxohepta-3-ene-1,7-dioic acid hydratase in catechol pathway